MEIVIWSKFSAAVVAGPKILINSLFMGPSPISGGPRAAC
jgi:hypothetical protein